MTTHKAHRSAVSGKFVTERFAVSHPKTTVRETIKTPPKPKGK
jgi:hypothetical protein